MSLIFLCSLETFFFLLFPALDTYSYGPGFLLKGASVGLEWDGVRHSLVLTCK